MNQGFFDALRAFVFAVIDLFWTLAAWAMDAARFMGPVQAALAALVLLGLHFGVAQFMQGRLNSRLEDRPEREVNMWLQELMFTLPGLVCLLLALPFILIARAVRGASKAVNDRLEARRKRKAAEAAGEEGAVAPPVEDEEPEEPPVPVLVASIGPSYLGAAVVSAFVYVLGVLSEPLLRAQLDLAEGLPAWEYLIFGDRPELQWYLPLAKFPWLAALLTIVFWFVIWTWTGRVIRLVLIGRLNVNLFSARSDEGVLRPWRTWFGAPELWRPHPTYVRWAKWLPIAALPMLLVGWAMLAGEPYRASPSMFSISLLLAFSWALHFSVEGLERGEEEEEPEPEPEEIVANGWAEVVDELCSRLQLERPHLFEPPRPVDDLPYSRVDPSSEGIVSPLLNELLAGDQTFTHMQYVVLRALSLQGYVHTDPPLPRGELELGIGAAGVEDLSGMRHRNQIVLAPEGAGKTTLAMLAACNQALVHTRCTLIVCRDQGAADEMRATIRRAIEPSTLRWNIRARGVGADLVNDLAQGIVPDVLVCSLHQLVVNVLDEPLTYSPFLENLGLIVVDDVESFCGPIETHAQLAFRRLQLRVRELLGVHELGEESAPMVLVLGADTMHDTPAWSRTLCGVDAVARYFAYNTKEAAERDEAFKAFQGLRASKGEAAEEGEEGASAPPAGAGLGRHQLVYRLNDFRNADDEVVDIGDLVESCERLAVPWTYRPCGDTRRRLGRQRLHLRDEPKYFVASPEDACVVILEGCYSEVRREIDRLSRAGARFEPARIKRDAGGVEGFAAARKGGVEQEAGAARDVPIAIVTVVDRDEEMALTEMNAQSSLAHALRTLPRPVVRPPTGRMVREHMAAEMTASWVEVEDLLEVFGNQTARTLSQLADRGLLMSEERVDLHPDVQRYEHRVYVRATSRAVSEGNERAGVLPPKVAQVELPSGDKVSVRDRTTLALIAVADRASAWYVYYPGRIFENALGRFVVVGHGHEEEELSARDVMVEPFLNDGLSSPRRRVWFYHTTTNAALARHEALSRGQIWEKPESLLPPLEPVLIGGVPLAVALDTVTCITEHVATYRLGPVLNEVRQRLIWEQGSAQRHAPAPLGTVALGVFPNPPGDDGHQRGPLLELEQARLIASAMRAVLPTMYRGAEGGIEVALHVEAISPPPDHRLGPYEGFYLYDPLPGGTGAARALHRDGVELLLRLCRVYIERVLYHDRLRARHDLWGDEAEIMRELGAHGADDPDASSDDLTPAVPDGGSIRETDRATRRGALVWLDSRLRPEGSLSGGRALGQYGSGSEQGEGDLSDIGRCWFSSGGAITDLLWAKHRWKLDERGGEAMLDVGFDRDTAATSRDLLPGDERVDAFTRPLAEQLANGAFALDDQTVWGLPRNAWVVEPGGEVPVATDGNLATEQALLDYQLYVASIAAHDYEALGPLAQLLQDRSGVDDPKRLSKRWALIKYLARFVQGIPSGAVASPRGSHSPVQTLLRRLGDCDSKSLTLAILLRHCGVDSGLFVSLETGDAMCAAAALEVRGGDAAEADAAGKLREAAKLQGEDLVFGLLPSRPGGPEAGTALFVPVDPMRAAAPGSSRLDDPNQWVFVPLSAAWYKMGLDRVEEEPRKKDTQTTDAQEAES